VSTKLVQDPERSKELRGLRPRFLFGALEA